MISQERQEPAERASEFVLGGMKGAYRNQVEALQCFDNLTPEPGNPDPQDFVGDHGGQ